MEVQKRKRIDDDNEEIDTKEAKIVKQVEVDDDEVEEFFAIIKRIRVAVKYFKKSNTLDGGGEKNLTREQPRNLVFSPEDFKGQECVEDNVVGLDLTADPKQEKKISSALSKRLKSEEKTFHGKVSRPGGRRNNLE
ncbi:hypothetical protein HAX54_048598 [Datura stramonium]|uniref:Uncharacterized protein n=1 Tax=Datura stramonium TaxID=4076 RepID=A0ABS8WP60_DATST|nr:hypothetical protein [Datura stramonium]